MLKAEAFEVITREKAADEIVSRYTAVTVVQATPVLEEAPPQRLTPRKSEELRNSRWNAR